MRIVRIPASSAEYTLPALISSMLFLYKLLIQKEINHIDIQNAVIIIPTLSYIFPYNNFRERISCKPSYQRPVTSLSGLSEHLFMYPCYILQKPVFLYF